MGSLLRIITILVAGKVMVEFAKKTPEGQIIKGGVEVVGVHQFNRIPQSLRIIGL